ncbi:23S rRNA (guanosine(2251)-2'-O)-methyltransferase RlmB [Spiroplasma endosymbiont of Virgichneumon dumeticola]|uniref:23S rRNA (guanosine(2251)-2'-O)-methyltransferase RlmB n=1 Tax=Spiroplasma endosymbiont of Virgichneumon dumeticola TaxID=3139323 RepID=UPI0035C93704
MALEYIYGYHPVVAAINPQSLIKVRKVFLVQDKYRELKPELSKNKIEYEIIGLEAMNNLLKTTKHQNIAAYVKNYDYFTLDQLLSLQPINKFARFLILDRISDPHNFGSMLRIGAGNDFDGVIILNRNQSEINGAVAKASAGALSIIPICQVKNLTTAINKLKNEHNFWILAAAKTDKAIDYLDVKCDSNLGLIIGNEGEGISPKLLTHTDFVVQIPMSNNIESFNASVACGIIANHIYIQTVKLNTNIS